ncbi:MAG: metallophosphoesterase family protein [Nitrososphaeraceae archaeon]
MIRLLNVIFALVIASVLIAPTYALTQEEFKNNIGPILQGNTTAIVESVSSHIGGNFSSIDKYLVDFDSNATTVNSFSISQYGNESWIPIIVNGTLVNGTVVIPPTCPADSVFNETSQTCVPLFPPQPPIEICGDGIDNNNNGLVDEGCPIIPPVTPDEPVKDVNSTQWLRVCAVGDVDNNNGLVTQVNLMHDYNCQIVIIPGDFEYTNGPAVIQKLADKGYDRENTAIINGNHDNCNDVKSFMQTAQCYGEVVFGQSDINGYLGIFSIDANSDFQCSGTQFDKIKDQIVSSDAWYNIPVIHQPFVTVPSDHSGNGKFACFDPVFRGNGINLVLQAHNHNYQRVDVNGINYMVVGTGTHDTGSSMYPLNGNSWQGFDCQKCITGTNGITILDLKIDDPAMRQVNAWFLSNSGNVEDRF